MSGLALTLKWSKKQIKRDISDAAISVQEYLMKVD